ncbi:MAG: accC2, partial [Frankiales bacterium]|nr:accC2 [Frankiales bacterium]
MPALPRLLVANRGEVAVRVLRAAADLGLPAVAVTAGSDTAHARSAPQVHVLPGDGPAAYADGAALVAAALVTGCTHVHPGYGFLSERADFADALTAAGLVLVGPTADSLRLLGDKGSARALAVSLGVPVPDGGGLDRAA